MTNKRLSLLIAAAACGFAFLIAFVSGDASHERDMSGDCQTRMLVLPSNWLDQAPEPSCEEAIAASRLVGERRYARIAGAVYALDDRRKEEGLIVLTPFARPVDPARLQPHLGGEYAREGGVLYHGAHAVRAMDPPIDVRRLRRVEGSGSARPGYVTDGRWVLHGEEVLEGAEPESFRPFAPPPGSEMEKGRYGGERSAVQFARDAHGVYFGARRLDGADAASFRPIYVSDDAEADIRPGYWALDRQNAWQVFDGELLQVPAEEDPYLLRRLSAFSPPWKERFPVLRYLALPAAALAGVGYFVFALRTRERIWLRHRRALFTAPVGMLATAFLILPAILLRPLQTVWHRPDDLVLFAFFGGALCLALVLLGLFNFSAMDRSSAAAATAVQLGMLAAFLAIGMFPPVFIDALRSMPNLGAGPLPVVADAGLSLRG